TLIPPSDLITSPTEPTSPLDPPTSRTSRSQPLTLPLQHLPPLPPMVPHCPIPPTHTPVNSPLLASLLTGHPNSDFTTYLLQGFTWGFKPCPGHKSSTNTWRPNARQGTLLDPSPLP
ncbi:hypothetical protein GBAR_LOCUS12163, partial [Geodia barretti]